MAYQLQGSVSRYDNDGNALEYDFTKQDIRTLAKQAGYTGPAEFASSYLQGYRDSSGNVVVDPSKGGAVSKDPRVFNVLQQYGLNDASRVFQNEYANVAETDPQVNGLLEQWSSNNRAGFTLEPWMLAAAPALVAGGMAAAGAGAAEGGLAAGAAAEGGALAGGEFGLGSGAVGSGIGGGSAGLGYGGVGGVETIGGIGSVAGGGGAVGSALGAAGSGFALPEILKSIPPEVWKGGIQAVLGYLGADKQADAYKDVANSQAAIGAPFRGLLQQSYGPNFNLMNQPGYGDAFDRMADIATRSWSAKSGNPANTPGIQGGILNDVWNQSYLPALANYRGQLGQFGGLGLNTAGAASLAAAQGAGGKMDAIGYGLGTGLEGVLGKKSPDLDLTVGGLRL